MGQGLVRILKSSLEPLTGEGTKIALEATMDGILGQVAAGLVSFRLSYKQKRFEENTKTAIVSMMRRERRLEQKLSDISEQMENFIRDKALPITFDFSIDETESQKIELIVNGLESVIEKEISDEGIILTYNDVLSELRLNEVARLLFFDKRSMPERLELDLSRLSLAMDETKDGRRQYQQLQGHDSYIDSKLQRLHLIETVVDAGSFNDEAPEPSGERKLTTFGLNFIDFFKINKSV